MSNEKNLIPNSERTPSELREITSKGGKKSGEVRRRKKSMKQVMDMLLNMPTNNLDDWQLLTDMGIDTTVIDEKTINNLLIVNVALLKNAKDGDVASIKELRDIIQDNAQNEKIKLEKQRLKLEQKKLEPNKQVTNEYRGIPSSLIAPAFSQLVFDIESQDYSEFDLIGGRGSTKSSNISLNLIDLLMKNEQMHALALRQVSNTLKDSVYSQILWAISALGLDDEFTYTKSPLEITRIATGQKIYFRGADDPNKIKSIKPQFGYIGVLWFEELDQFHGEEAVRKIEQSVIRGGDLAYKFKSFNPPKSANNWANKYVKIPRADKKVIESTYLTVPRKWLGKAFLDDAEFLKTTNPTAYENEYLGIANGTGGNVFDNVTIRAVTDDEIKEFDRIYRGVDWGWYPDPWAYNCMYYNANQHILIIYDEAHCNKKSNKETAEILKNEKGVTANDLIICDSAEHKSVADYKSFGLLARDSEKGAGSVEYSMKWLQSLNEIVIDNVRCPETVKEFLNYEYERDKDGNVISGYPDHDNHHIDAVRYAMNKVWKKKGK